MLQVWRLGLDIKVPVEDQDLPLEKLASIWVLEELCESDKTLS